MGYAWARHKTKGNQKCEDKTYSRCSFQPISTLYLVYYIKKHCQKGNAGLHSSKVKFKFQNKNGKWIFMETFTVNIMRIHEYHMLFPLAQRKCYQVLCHENSKKRGSEILEAPWFILHHKLCCLCPTSLIEVHSLSFIRLALCVFH